MEELQFDDAEKFVAYLRPSPQNWGPFDDYACPWVFRGQSDADWHLIPSAWRPDARAEIEAVKARLGPRIGEYLTYDTTDPGSLACPRSRAVEHIFHVAAEREMVFQFVDLADELGYFVHQLKEVRHPPRGLDRYVKGQTIDGPTPNFAFALAQHHGIPTRLLDWTRKGLVAAFFAAEGVQGQRASAKPPTYLAVWALDHEAGRGWNWDRLICPRHQFPFLHAQDGLFTWLCTGDAYFVEHGSWPPFEEHLEPDYDRGKPLRKLTLPVEQADDLLKILFRERISRAHLMPTYDNVVATLRTKWSWR